MPQKIKWQIDRLQMTSVLVGFLLTWHMLGLCGQTSTEKIILPRLPVGKSVGHSPLRVQPKEWVGLLSSLGTTHNKPHTRDLLRKTQEGGYLYSEEKQQKTEQEAGFIYGFLCIGEVGECSIVGLLSYLPQGSTAWQSWMQGICLHLCHDVAGWVLGCREAPELHWGWSTIWGARLSKLAWEFPGLWRG